MSLTVYSVMGDRYTFLLTGKDTNGAYSVFDFWVPPGGGSPPHVHHREDEAFCIVEGQFEFVVDGKPVRLGPGGSIFGKRDIPHNFTNVGTTPGRIVCTVTPAGLEDFFAEIGTKLLGFNDPTNPVTPDVIAKLLSVAPKYGLEIFAKH